MMNDKNAISYKLIKMVNPVCHYYSSMKKTIQRFSYKMVLVLSSIAFLTSHFSWIILKYQPCIKGKRRFSTAISKCIMNDKDGCREEILSTDFIHISSSKSHIFMAPIFYIFCLLSLQFLLLEVHQRFQFIDWLIH